MFSYKMIPRSHQLFISLFVILSFIGQYSTTVTPQTVYLETEPANMVFNTIETLPFLRNLKKRADDLFNKEEEEKKKSGQDSKNDSNTFDDVEDDLVGKNSKGNEDDLKLKDTSFTDSNKQDDKPSNPTDQQVFDKKVSNPNEGMLYDNKLDEAEKEAKRKDESLSGKSNDESDMNGNGASNDKQEDKHEDKQEDKQENKQDSAQKDNSQDQPQDHSSTSSTMIEKLKPTNMTSENVPRHDNHPAEHSNHSKGVISTQSESSSASNLLPAFSLIIGLIGICFF